MTQMKVKKPSGFKRALAAIVDLFLALVAFFVIYSFVVQPCYYNMTDYKKVAKDYYGALQDTGLYEFNEETFYCNIVSFETKKDEEVKPVMYYDFYDHLLENYYKNNGKLDTYVELKTNSKLFDETGKLLDKTTNRQIQDFYVTSIQGAIDNIFLKDEVNKKNLNIIQNYSTQMLIFSVLPSFILIYMGIPLLLNNGQTLGKKLFNLRVASTKVGFKIPIGTMLLRQAIVIVVGYIASVFTMFLTPIIFLIGFLAHKEGKSLDDLLASTIVYENVQVDESDEAHTLTIKLTDSKIDEKPASSEEPSVPHFNEEEIIDESTLNNLATPEGENTPEEDKDNSGDNK